MSVRIFSSYEEFKARDHYRDNGVSRAFAKENPGYASNNYSNIGCWNCLNCIQSFNCHECDNCCACNACKRCDNCHDCESLTGSSWFCDNKELIYFDTPVVENIHQRVFEAIQAEGCILNMDDWHDCKTTHCRGGWVIEIAGERGRKMESLTSPSFAAMRIYDASSPIKIALNRFYDKDEVAMADIIRCAEQEKQLNQLT